MVLVPTLLLGQQPTAEDTRQTLDSLKRETEAMRQMLERNARRIAELEARERQLQAQAAAKAEPQQQAAPSAATAELQERVSLVEQEMVDNRVNESRRLELHAYGEVNMEKFQDTRSSLDPRILELIVSGRPVNRLRFFSEIEFERVAAIGTRRGGELAIEQGWIELTLKDWLRPRAGVVNVPFGWYNQNHFVTQQDHVDKPLLGRVIVPGTWSDVAFGTTGQAARKSLNFTYETYVLQGLQQGINNRGLADARPAFGADNNGNKALAAQFRVTSGPFYRAGISVYRGHFDNLGRQAITGWAYDGKWGRGPFEAMAEYARFTTQSGAVVVPRLFHGYTTEAKWSLRPEFLRKSIFGEGFEDPRIELVARWENAWIDNAAKSPIRDERRLTVGLNYRPNQHLVLKSGYQFNHSNNFALQRGNVNGLMSSVAFYF